MVNMKTKKSFIKPVAVFLMIVLVLAALAGCSSGGGSNSGSDSSGSSSSSSSGSSGGGAVNLTMGTGENTDVKINVVSSGGSAANISDIVLNKTVELATVQSDVMTYAYNGTNSFEESGAMSDFRVIGGLYAETVQIITCDPNLTSVEDLRGRSICVGDIGSGTYYNTVDVLAAYDMTIDDVNPIYQSFGDSAESLKDGKIDAAVITAGAPTTAVTDLATSKEVYLISIDDEHMTKILNDCPWYAELTIPAGTYAGFDQDAVTVTVKATLVCSSDLDEDTVYTLTKTIYDGASDIAGLHAKGEELSVEFATDGIAVPFHAGAAKYFAEQNVTVETN